MITTSANDQTARGPEHSGHAEPRQVPSSWQRTSSHDKRFRFRARRDRGGANAHRPVRYGAAMFRIAVALLVSGLAALLVSGSPPARFVVGRGTASPDRPATATDEAFSRSSMTTSRPMRDSRRPALSPMVSCLRRADRGPLACPDRAAGGRAARFLDRLGQIDHSALSFDNAIDAQAVELQIRSELQSLETLRLWAVNPMAYSALPGAAIDALMKRDFAPKKDRLRSWSRGCAPAGAVRGRARQRHRVAKEFTDVALAWPRHQRLPRRRWRPGRATRPGAMRRCSPSSRPPMHRRSRPAARSSSGSRRSLPRSTASYALGEARFLEKLKYEEMVACRSPSCWQG